MTSQLVLLVLQKLENSRTLQGSPFELMNGENFNMGPPSWESHHEYGSSIMGVCIILKIFLFIERNLKYIQGMFHR